MWKGHLALALCTTKEKTLACVGIQIQIEQVVWMIENQLLDVYSTLAWV
jgi:hypothetical protein